MARLPKRLSHMEIVVYVLGSLGGATRRVLSEHIATGCYAIAPAEFSWSLPEYRARQWPDKYIAKVALEDARRPRNGALVVGSWSLDVSKDGWRLTSQGVLVWSSVQSLSEVPRIPLPENEGREGRRILGRLERHELYRQYLSGRGLGHSAYRFYDLLNCSPDVPREVMTTKVDLLLAVAEAAKSEEVKAFLNACRDRFLCEGRTSNE